jgi:hypothetical protein
MSSVLHADLTVKEFRELMATNSASKAAVMFYIRGLAEGIQWADSYNATSELKKRIFCVRGILALNVESWGNKRRIEAL